MAKDGIYRDFKKEDVETALIKACDRVGAPKYVLKMLEDAINDPLWNHMKDYNGCTLVEDPTHPYVPCFLHDWMWRTGRGGLEADNIFYHTQVLFGMPKKMARRRYYGVRIGWFTFFKWKYVRIGLKTPHTESIKEFF